MMFAIFSGEREVANGMAVFEGEVASGEWGVGSGEREKQVPRSARDDSSGTEAKFQGFTRVWNAKRARRSRDRHLQPLRREK